MSPFMLPPSERYSDEAETYSELLPSEYVPPTDVPATESKVPVTLYTWVLPGWWGISAVNVLGETPPVYAGPRLQNNLAVFAGQRERVPRLVEGAYAGDGGLQGVNVFKAEIV